MKSITVLNLEKKLDHFKSSGRTPVGKLADEKGEAPVKLTLFPQKDKHPRLSNKKNPKKVMEERSARRPFPVELRANVGVGV